MQPRATIFDYHEGWKGPITLSLIAHAAFAGSILGIGMFLSRPGVSWGGEVAGEGAISATLVSSAIPLPTSPTENVLATESKGLAESVPKKETPEPDAIPIPDKNTKTLPKALTPTKQKPTKPVDVASNQVPFGQGGPAGGLYTTVRTQTGSGGLAVGGGNFGSRYSWYVEAVRRKISENWLKYEVDPSITSAPRVYLTFEIDRMGQPVNVRISQSSGVPSLDYSAMRALQRIDTFGPLPPDYGGGSVMVEFYFDFKR